jgi:NADH-quinone oxidoreductase subunit H
MNPSDVPLAIFYTLVFPGLLFTGVVGLALTWIHRKITAIVQSRIGPPWFQPYADIGKLLGKKMVIPRDAPVIGFLGAPLLAITGATLTAVIVFRSLLQPSAGFVGDLIVLFYLSALPAIALMIGGAASRSPFGAIGASREMSMVLAYEAGFLLAVITVMIHTQSVRLADVHAFQAANGSIAGSPSGLLAMIVFVLCMQAKLGFIPFDISEADTELIGGPLAEYSGTGLALFKLARSMLFLVLPTLCVLLFLGPVRATALSVVGFLPKLLAVLAALILIKATHARLRLDQALRLFWGRIALAGLVAAGLALLGL